MRVHIAGRTMAVLASETKLTKDNSRRFANSGAKYACEEEQVRERFSLDCARPQTSKRGGIELHPPGKLGLSQAWE